MPFFMPTISFKNSKILERNSIKMFSSTNTEHKGIQETIRDYFDDTYRFSQSAQVQEIIEDKDLNQLSIITDRTIFHPQGGGQPKDQG